MRYKRPDLKNANSILNSAKETMDFTLCFRMLGDAILVKKGINSEDHILPIKEIASLKINSKRPISSIENLRNLRHNINYNGYKPNMFEVQDTISLAKECFYKAYEEIKKVLQ